MNTRLYRITLLGFAVHRRICADRTRTGAERSRGAEAVARDGQRNTCTTSISTASFPANTPTRVAISLLR